VQSTIIERLARRYAADGTDAGFAAAARMIAAAPSIADQDRVIDGILAALSGRKLDQTPEPLKRPMEELLTESSPRPNVLDLALRLNLPSAVPRALAVAKNPAATPEARSAMIRALGETRTSAAVDGLLEVLQSDAPEAIQSATLTALTAFDDDRIASTVLKRHPQLPAAAQARAVALLVSRPSWAGRLVASIDGKQLPETIVSLEQVRQMHGQADPDLQALLEKHWGRMTAATPLEMQGRITAVSQMLGRGPGDAARGRHHFEKTCANCHKLHGQGNAVGPDLTGAERKNRDLLVRNIVDPSAIVREQFIMHVAVTTDGRVLEGLLADSTADTITLLDAKNQRTVLNRADLDELAESPISLMPEKLLDTLTPQERRDLFKYLQQPKP
jgi:putative heme-binding domain-containing protein